MKKRYNDNDRTDEFAQIKKQKDADSKKYELEVQSILASIYGYKFVERTNEIPEYDMETIAGVKVEVKSDYSLLSSKKLFIEIWDNLGERKFGWFRYCSADILAVVAVENFTPMKIIFYDFKALQSYVLSTYFDDDWANTETIYKDEYGDRFVFALKDRPYLKYMLIELRKIQKFVMFEFEYPWN